MIKTFRCQETERLYRERVAGKRFTDVAYRRLFALDHAKELRDLQRVPGYRLEKLRGESKSQYSIRVNDQWRICFEWRRARPTGLKSRDYH